MNLWTFEKRHFAIIKHTLNSCSQVQYSREKTKDFAKLFHIYNECTVLYDEMMLNIVY